MVKAKSKARSGSINYRKATYPSALRMARLVDEMPRHGLGRRFASVAADLGVSTQTLRRYVKALNEEFQTEDGEPQFMIEKQGGEDWLTRKLKYDDDSRAHIYQLISVYLSMEIFKMLGGNNLFVDLVDEIFKDVETRLSNHQRDLIKDLPRKFFSAPWAPKDYSGHDDMLSDVIKAIVYQRVVKMDYKPGGGEPCDYAVKPLTLLYHKGGLYLIGKTDRHDRPVFFNVERMREVEVTGEKFDYPSNYHPEQLLEGAFGIFSGGEKKSFKLRFPPSLADYICSRRWHRSQECLVHEDGSVTLAMEVTDSEEIRSWIRGFGENVEVVSELENPE